MEEQTRWGSRRTRFIDDVQLENLSNEHTASFFETEPTIPILAVLHDAVPDLGNGAKKSGVRIAEPPPTLANLTTEFNDLSRTMTVLKETIKSGGKASDKKKSGPMQSNSSSQTIQIDNLTNVAAAKQVVYDCIAELTSINHFLDGNEEMAAVYREKLRHVITNEYGKAEAIVMQEASFARDTRSPIRRADKIMVDMATGVSDNSLNQYVKEAAIQTDAEPTEIIQVSNEKAVNKTVDVSLNSRPVIDEANEQTKRSAFKNKFRRW